MTQAGATQPAPDPDTLPLDAIDVSDPALFESDAIHGYFRRLRRDSPVHHCAHSDYGPFWSLTRYDDIVEVESRPDLFSSDGASGGHMLQYHRLFDPDDDFQLPMFIAMDEPAHGQARKTVTPMVAPANLARMESDIRARACAILDDLPVGETFDWVRHLSIELTTQVLATLFDFPFEHRARLTYWSDLTMEESRDPAVKARRKADLLDCAQQFTELWEQRRREPPKQDLLSMLAHGPATRDMSQAEFLGNTLLLIVGGNDTTRNSLSGGVLALNRNPEAYARLRANPKLVPSLVPEIIRWQTPLAHMARTVTRDTEISGQQIRAGERVVMWYLSGNRDDRRIDDPEALIIDRAQPRQHLSFGFGIHRCLGNRLAEMQLRVAWEEILKRFETVELMGDPVRTRSNMIHGYLEMPVQLHRC